MPFDWSSRHNNLGDHKHLQEQILDAATGQVAGAAQTVSRLGPVSIDFSDFVGDPIPTGFEIPVGATVIKAWAVITAWEDSEDGATIRLAICDATDLTSTKTLVQYNAFDGIIPATAYAYTEMGPLNSGDATQVLANAPRSAVARVAATIVALGTGALTDGSFEVYALIATPA